MLFMHEKCPNCQASLDTSKIDIMDCYESLQENINWVRYTIRELNKSWSSRRTYESDRETMCDVLSIMWGTVEGLKARLPKDKNETT